MLWGVVGSMLSQPNFLIPHKPGVCTWSGSWEAPPRSPPQSQYSPARKAECWRLMVIPLIGDCPQLWGTTMPKVIHPPRGWHMANDWLTQELKAQLLNFQRLWMAVPDWVPVQTPAPFAATSQVHLPPVQSYGSHFPVSISPRKPLLVTPQLRVCFQGSNLKQY